jgi:Lipase (class 3)
MTLTISQAPFASSRVGNKAFATFIENQAPAKGQNLRVSHIADPVPDLPLRNISLNGNYIHFTPSFQITSGDTEIPTNANVIPVPDDNTDNSDVNADLPDFEAHNQYINGIANCGGTSVALVAIDNAPRLTTLLEGLVKQFPDLKTLKLIQFLLSLASLSSFQSLPIARVVVNS